jgi:hypothetical protein
VYKRQLLTKLHHAICLPPDFPAQDRKIDWPREAGVFYQPIREEDLLATLCLLLNRCVVLLGKTE